MAKRIQVALATVLFLVGITLALEARTLACGGDGGLCGSDDIACSVGQGCWPESVRISCGECNNGQDCIEEIGSCKPGAGVCFCSSCGSAPSCQPGIGC